MIIDLIVDVGSENIKIFRRGAGVVLNEPSLALVDRKAKSVSLRETGIRAKKLAADFLKEYAPVHPIKNGVIADEEIAASLFRAFFEKIDVKPTFPDVLRVVALVGCGLSYSDRRTVARVFKAAGASRVYVVDGLLGLYSFADVPRGFFVDIGGASANIGFVSAEGVTAGCQADMGGNTVNEAISYAAETRYGVLIKNQTAEKIKLASGGLNAHASSKITLNGRDGRTGEYRAVTMFAGDIAASVRSLLDNLVLLINAVLYSLPENDYNYVCRNGFYLAGGTANLPGLAEYLAESLRLRVLIVKENETAAVTGGERFFEEKGLLRKMLV
jgi:rod shape-determining protein MreB